MDCQARGTKVRFIHHRETLYHQRELLLRVYATEGENTSGEFRESTPYLWRTGRTQSQRNYGESRRGGQSRWCSMA